MPVCNRDSPGALAARAQGGSRRAHHGRLVHGRTGTGTLTRAPSRPATTCACVYGNLAPLNDRPRPLSTSRYQPKCASGRLSVRRQFHKPWRHRGCLVDALRVSRKITRRNPCTVSLSRTCHPSLTPRCDLTAGQIVAQYTRPAHSLEAPREHFHGMMSSSALLGRTVECDRRVTHHVIWWRGLLNTAAHIRVVQRPLFLPSSHHELLTAPPARRHRYVGGAFLLCTTILSQCFAALRVSNLDVEPVVRSLPSPP